jgi:DNA polymerase III, alpha subunit
VAGLLTQVNHRVARSSGNPYGQLAIEDFSGELQVMCLGKSYTEHQDLLQPDSIVSIRGRVQRRDDQVTLHANIVRALSLQPQESHKWDGPFALQVPEHHATVEVLTELQTALANHPGDTPVHLKLVTAERARVFQLTPEVEVSANLIAEVKGILGRDCLVVAEKAQPSSVAAR